MASTSILTTIAQIFGTLLTLSVEIALLVIALTTVKARRPDAVMPLAAGAVGHAIGTLLQPLLYALVVPIFARDIGGVASIYAVLSMFFTIIHVVAWGAVLFGIVKLAGPAGPNDPTRYG